MPGKKSRRSSLEIIEAEIQLAAVNRVDPNLQLGEGETVQTYAEAIAQAQRELEAYHQAAEALAAQRIKLKAAKKKVRSLTSRILAAVAFAFGKESTQYTMVGGIRPSEIKRSAPTKKESGQAA